jgi:hypothetical protein
VFAADSSQALRPTPSAEHRFYEAAAVAADNTMRGEGLRQEHLASMRRDYPSRTPDALSISGRCFRCFHEAATAESAIGNMVPR